MKPWALIVVLLASAIALVMIYAASPLQRRLRRPLAAFPARVSAMLAALVALRAWIEALGANAGLLAWSMSVLVLLATFRKSLWVA